ncbi:MAG: 5'/3'-nucleotidase SurE [Planctomycetota bacterium]
MHILLTNDDGIFAPGLAAIYKRLTGLGKITVAAPSDVHPVRCGTRHFAY